ncbi:MAG: gamma-glutamyl-gamma-aminobutyrate hydrolase family protein [Ignavibacteriales bacterium]
MRPLVAVTTSVVTSSAVVPNRPSYYVDSVYTESLASCGAAPVLIPAHAPWREGSVHDLMCMFSGLLVTGGPVLPAECPPDQTIPPLRDQDPDRYDFEIDLILEATRQRIPILGICRGMQVMNEALGGATHLNLLLAGVTKLDHNQGNMPESDGYHPITVSPGSLLSRLTDAKDMIVNSFHRQGVEHPGPGVRDCAVSSDGVVEAIEFGDSFCLGLQFHPERMMHVPCMKGIMDGFVEACTSVSGRR